MCCTVALTYRVAAFAAALHHKVYLRVPVRLWASLPLGLDRALWRGAARRGARLCFTSRAQPHACRAQACGGSYVACCTGETTPVVCLFVCCRCCCRYPGALRRHGAPAGSVRKVRRSFLSECNGGNGLSSHSRGRARLAASKRRMPCVRCRLTVLWLCAFQSLTVAVQSVRLRSGDVGGHAVVPDPRLRPPHPRSPAVRESTV